MENKKLFETNRHYSGILFKNVATAPPNVFDDLADDAESFKVAHRYRKSHQNMIFLDLANAQEKAIDLSFNTKLKFESRYGDGSIAVWYGCVKDITTLFETAYWMIAIELNRNPKFKNKKIVRYRKIYTVECNAILLDLYHHRDYYDRLTSENYSLTQHIGKTAQQNNFAGLITPSARLKGEENVAAFTPVVLSQPKEYVTLKYTYDPIKRTVTIKSLNTEKSHFDLTVDFNTWG